MSLTLIPAIKIKLQIVSLQNSLKDEDPASFKFENKAVWKLKGVQATCQQNNLKAKDLEGFRFKNHVKLSS